MSNRALPPAGITQTQSYTWVLRESFLNVLTALPYFAGFQVRRNNAEQVQPEQVPLLAVYLMPERMTPDGDADAGYNKFIHAFEIGFSVIIQNNDSDQAEQELDKAFWLIMNVLWRHADLTNMINTNGATPDNTRIEGITAGVRRHVFGAIGSNETPVAELQYEVTGTYRSEFAVIPTDDLLAIYETVIPAGYDPTKTPPVDVRYFTPLP
jgi:hypothetical protein